MLGSHSALSPSPRHAWHVNCHAASDAVSHERNAKGGGMDGNEPRGLTPEELEAESAIELPDREAMSVVGPVMVLGASPVALVDDAELMPPDEATEQFDTLDDRS